MAEENELATVPKQSALTPIQALQMQIVQTGDLEKLKQLREIEREWRKDQAKMAYQSAMQKFKANLPKIPKNRTAEIRKDGRVVGSYQYASVDSVCDAIVAQLASVGIIHRWQIEKEDGTGMTIACILECEGWEVARDSMWGPWDTSGMKNVIQSHGSTKSYLERYTLLSSVGMASGEYDNDAASNAKPCLSPERAQFIVESLTSATTLEELRMRFNAATKEAAGVMDAAAVAEIEKIKDEMKAKISHGGAK